MLLLFVWPQVHVSFFLHDFLDGKKMAVWTLMAVDNLINNHKQHCYGNCSANFLHEYDSYIVKEKK
jgi:hypothetical protein